MNKAIELARANAQIASDEIVYLRQQLIIGGSTLDSVLSQKLGYTRLNRRVHLLLKSGNRITDRSTLGLLSHAFDLSQ